jgi:hypothetical protein
LKGKKMKITQNEKGQLVIDGGGMTVPVRIPVLDSVAELRGFVFESSAYEFISPDGSIRVSSVADAAEPGRKTFAHSVRLSLLHGYYGSDKGHFCGNDNRPGQILTIAEARQLAQALLDCAALEERIRA